MTIARLENWAMVEEGGAYTAPELRRRHLVGNVYGHPGRHHDGKSIRTSRIAAAEGRVVTTKSGQMYLLGVIDPGYRKHLAEHHPDWDPENPIRVRKA